MVRGDRGGGALVGAIMLAVAATWSPASAACGPVAGGGYAGSVQHYIADLKPSFSENKSYSARTALTAGNYRAVLAGLRAVGVDGVRLPIWPRHRQAAGYGSLYANVVNAARGLGLMIYASPSSVGMKAYAGWSDDDYAAWLADYARTFGPDVLSPFNEAGLDDARMASIVAALRPRLGGSVLLAGPDREHLDNTLRHLAADPLIGAAFDIVDSHSAGRDGSAVAGNWAQLVRSAGKPVWSSENPAGWSRGQSGSLPGLDQAVAGGVNALVIWMAKPTLVDDAGRPTAKACEIAANLLGGR